ncbi:hypothetical protein NL676_009361 [Syzygium grande]|nr:hypothetical protein NL676_009361 [Syzygium grande]
MALRAKALTAIVVAVAILSLTMLLNWPMAFLILLGMIAFVVNRAVEMMKIEPILPVYAPAPAVDAPIDALALSVDAPVDAWLLSLMLWLFQWMLWSMLRLLQLMLGLTPALSVDAPVDAPALGVDALALSVDALALSVDAPVDAPVLVVDALSLSVDAAPLAPVVVAARIKMRRKPVSFLCIFGIGIVTSNFFDINTVESVLLLAVQPSKC